MNSQLSNAVPDVFIRQIVAEKSQFEVSTILPTFETPLGRFRISPLNKGNFYFLETDLIKTPPSIRENFRFFT